MKRLIAALILISALGCYGQTVASFKRYLTPLQYIFGPLTAISPYNLPVMPGTGGGTFSGGSSGTTYGNVAYPASLVQPSNLITNNNTFASTSDFTTLVTSGSPSFTVSGNVGTITTTGAGSLAVGSTASSFPMSNAFVSVEIDQNGSTAANDFAGVGIGNSSLTNSVAAAVYYYSGTWYARISLQNNATEVGQITGWTPPTAPWYLGLALVGNQAAMLYSTDGTNWYTVTGGTVTGSWTPDTTNLSGYQSFVEVIPSGASTWKFSNLVTSPLGGLGATGLQLVTYPDGRPYVDGDYVYATTGGGGGGGGIPGCGINPPYPCNDSEIYRINLATKSVEQLGVIAVDRSTGIYQIAAGRMTYDPQTGTERLMDVDWPTSSAPQVEYDSQSISTDDWLSTTSPYHVAPYANLVTLTALGTTSVDPSFACMDWNYSTNVCAKWLLGVMDETGTTELFTSTSDPSADSWTAVSIPSPTGNYTGATVYRQATTSGSSGVSYWSGYSGAALPISGLAANAESRLEALYTSAGAGASTMKASFIAGSNFPNPINLVGFGNTEYEITSAYTNGNIYYATAPRFGTQTNWPQLVAQAAVRNGSSSVTTVSQTFTQTAGDLLMVASKGGNFTGVSDSLDGALTCGSLYNSTDMLCYMFLSTSGSATITSTVSTAAPYLGQTFEEISPGFLTAIDGSISYGSEAAGSSFTSGTFSTTAGKGLVLVCIAQDASSGASVPYVPGSVGPYGASFGSGYSEFGPVCEGSLTNSAQTNIDATMAAQAATAYGWDYMEVAFK